MPPVVLVGLEFCTFAMQHELPLRVKDRPLTATRTGETFNAQSDEFDFPNRV
jgi:hypothetical protein